MSDLPVPGTVRLVDLAGTSTLRHGADQKDIILVPQPTNDPNDPLNWSKKRRLKSTIMQVVWAFFGAAFINALPPAYLLIEQETEITVANLNLGNGLMYLFFGFGNMLTQSLAINFGRRPAAVLSVFFTTFLVLWSSFMNTPAEWYANRILIGITMSGVECLPELCVTDTKFTHERGFHMGFYNWCLFGGAFVAPIPAGFLAEAVGWRWINRMYAIVGFVLAILTYFFFEETMFYRPDSVDEFLEQRGEKYIDDRDVKSSDGQGGEEQPAPASHATAAEIDQSIPVHSYTHRLKLWGLRDPRQPNNFFKFFFLPLTLLRYPNIVFSGILIGGVLSWFNVLSGTTALVFGSEPYNFGVNMIGLTNLACLIGTTAGCMLSGWLNDYLATWLARRNSGIKEPEARLWAAVIPLILHPAGCILYGVGSAHHIHWVGICFGMGLVTLSIVTASTLALSYDVDCYKEVAGESIVSVINVRNCIGEFISKNHLTLRLVHASC